MKSRKLIYLMLSLTFLISCGGQTSDQNKPGIYKCPMECEGEKTYAEPGKCPVCEMDLQVQ
ncbi:MAG: hypothetical protein HYZ14_15065 [Bacteroidetes bacterium]|nr:hypothetical protein [Bacteroidota bacterium]